jgi:hypothetical protein
MKRVERIDRVELMRTFVRIVGGFALSGGAAAGNNPGHGKPTVAVA